MVHMPHWPKKIIPITEVSDLARMDNILFALGNPHLKLPPAIHIAGTNGKGSSCAMLKSIFNNAGYKVHLYTSPHLIHFNERIEVAGNIIDDNLLFQMLEHVRIASESLNIEPTFFEATTAAAFLAFSLIPADILILETGLGGRLDQTNVITPILTLITPISYDHMEFLGSHIKLIANEKAGIIKPNIPCIISRQDPQVMEILLSKCEELNSSAIAYEYDYIPEKNEDGFFFHSQIANFQLPHLNLLGDHQIINASAVIAAIIMLREMKNFLSLMPNKKLTNEHIILGLPQSTWPGRLQKYNLSKIIKNAENVSCWLDGAHNIAGAAALADWIKEQKFDNLVLIIGLTKNRDIASFLSQFKELNPKIFGVKVLSEPSSYSSEILAEKAKAINMDVVPQDNLEEAFATAVLENKYANIIVTGSLFLVADCLKFKSL